MNPGDRGLKGQGIQRNAVPRNAVPGTGGVSGKDLGSHLGRLSAGQRISR